MRSIALLFIFLIVAGLASAQANNDLKTMSLKGKVKSVTNRQNYRYRKDGVFTPWEKQYTDIYQFNTTGFYSGYQQLFANGTQYYRIDYSYDMKAKKGEQAYFDKLNQATIKKEITYDDKGKLLELIEYNKDGVKDRGYKYVYNERGDNSELIYYKQPNVVGSSTFYLYDEKGCMTDVVVKTPGYANSSKKYVYDSKGNMIEETWFDGQKQPTFRFVRTYDDKGNKIEEVKYKGQNTTVHDRSTWKYEYDKQGNWTKRTQYTEDGTDYNVDERVITYY